MTGTLVACEHICERPVSPQVLALKQEGWSLLACVIIPLSTESHENITAFCLHSMSNVPHSISF